MLDETKNLKKTGCLTKPKDMKTWEIRVAHLKNIENNLIKIFSNLA
jgi:hypothetical protein